MQIDHSEYQDQLIRGLTHRMNNILTLFQGYVGLALTQKNLNQSTLEGLAKMKEGAGLASDLMDRTQALARPSALVWREVKLGDFVRMLKPSFDRMRHSATTLELEIPDDLPPVWADAARVKTAIVEIVRNALEATAEDGGQVKILLRAIPAPAGTHAAQQQPWVSLCVCDSGPGISEEIGERIFQPFYSSRKKQQNSGLGLTVALACVQQLGGVLHFTSKPGSTEFQLLLPCRESAA